jgi:hypothetical protein
MRHAAATLAAVLLATLACGSASAQWKWRDANGQITASDRAPPSGVPDRDILARPTDQRRARAAKPALAASAAASAARPGAAPGTDPELDARRQRAVDEQLAQQRQQQERDAAVRAENCSRARAHLAALADGLRMTRTNAQGEREVLDDKGRAEEMQRARGVIASDCR